MAYYPYTAHQGRSTRYRLEPMYAASNVEWAFMNTQLTRDPEFVKQVIRSYIDVKHSHGRTKLEISQKLEPLERAYPQFAQSFVEVRMERGLPNSRIIRLRINPSNSLQRASTTQSPNRPVGARPGGLGVQTTGNTTRRASAPSQSARPPVVRNPEDGDELPPPPYSSQDPEPEATRILQERLAAETNVEPAAVPSPSTPQTASNPALASPHSSPAPTRPGLVDSNPPSDPQMAQVWEESQLDEAKRASLAWREQQEFEEAMRLSLAEAESMGAGSSTGPGTSTNTQSGQNRLPVVDENDEQDSSLSQQSNPDLMGLVGGLEDLTFSSSEQASSSNNATHNQSSILDDDGPSGLNQQPLVPSKTGLVMQSKNPFLSQSEKETSGANGSSSYLDNTASTAAQASANGINQLPGRGSTGSTDTSYTPQPIYAPPPGPPPPHLRVPTSPAQSPSPPQNQASPGSRSLPRAPVSPRLSFPTVSQTAGPPAYSSQTASSSQQPSSSIVDGVAAAPPGLPPRRLNRRKSTYVPPTQGEDPLEMLREFDTVFLVDDSSSMKKDQRWNQACQAIMEVADLASRYDDDGIDVYFLNNKRVGRELRSSEDVEELFAGLEPRGITPTGMRLEAILRDYMSRLEASQHTGEEVKPMNLIVVTDGVFAHPVSARLRQLAVNPSLTRIQLLDLAPTDDPESVIVTIARRLDRGQYPLSQVGIQFLQIGNDPEAREALQELDDDLSSEHGIRDIVDTVPFNGEEMNAGLIIKTLLGGINRRLDRRSTA
ncbi:hypothetical protein C343_03612 [Cryptococcus neoformans C23]|uniref:VWFA domain-containing protein n=1 Tax=Cryptococcus neoformans (strain H99 / ATCC 208821 / CBS 10515 / FGSC 9487) TaxID=235443 RepID=J9VSD4_CRYN9|nr:hypothetical protein CNAG_02318 [Cryptococcus neoformans var. grubii H99]AUB25321.1 hypothetical protein CKF44_02318 [Cryptococcus neoformans var. grubii]OWZ31582.1 hypothetical protein C347_03675 [Cryptococcus neoformans var. grubii AD2-60a]OWZ42712.1 hypothetical protein C353_03518 [Cryptococcus neoformans var. grubii AD1-83a]OWZ43743.1 hypothetical protein C343_03612 [Cryptococcus neoformans var. grubii C23]OXC84399.1 hypothetical protein C344_03372 [Cryptococcus neoformans var. grubii A|eukprot:XP_012049760.1 hypothetical protein CNAG_02318 [Cryptococcus neoformans var. grubii H99]